MWILLLDASGSMADPFAGSAEFAGRVRETAAKIKIDAAREALSLHLRGLGATTETRVFAFRNSAELIYSGSSADVPAIEAALARVQPSGGTDVAAALSAALGEAAAHSNLPVIRVLLISDGLADPAAAQDASRRLLQLRMPVDVVLIDPSDKGLDLARKVAGEFGSVTAVASQAEISDAMAGVAEAMRADVAALEHVQASVAAAKRKLAADAPEENVSFIAAHPSELARNAWGSLSLYIHLSSLTDEARARARGAGVPKGADALSATAVASTRLPRGTELTITPRLAGFDVNPPNLAMTWEEDIQACEFRIRPRTAAEGPAIGEIEIVASGLPIGRVALSLTVRGEKAPRPSEQERKLAPGGAVETVFASYAREDIEIVRACEAAYNALGVLLIIDKEKLIGGQAWRPAIRALQAKADIFQLFWSKPASVSLPVREEILDAQTIEAERGVGYIRPLFWEEPPPPLPAELAHINFAFLDRERLSGARAEPAAAPDRGRDTPLPGAPNLPVAVLPLLRDTPSSAIAELRQDVAFAIDFVERTVGSRYYPVPTLLVDRHTVLDVRKDETTDFDRRERARLAELADWAEVLQSICLALHVRQFWPEEDRATAQATGRRAGLSEPAFAELLRRCEYGPIGWLKPSWLHRAGQRSRAIAEATRLQDAVSAAFAAAFAEPGAADETLQASAYDINNNPWALWEEELTATGLVCKGRGFDAELRGTRATFRAGLEKLGTYIEAALAGVGGRHEERAAPEQRLRDALRLADALGDRLMSADKFQHAFGVKDLVLREIDPARNWMDHRAALAAAGLPSVAPDQCFLPFADAFFDAASKVLRQLVSDGGDGHFQCRYSMPVSAWRRLTEAGFAPGLHFTASLSGEGEVMKPEGAAGAFADALEGAWRRARDLVRGEVSAPLARFVVAEAPTYGIFAPAAAVSADAQLLARAPEWGVPRPLCLPGTDRVLLCASAIDDFQSFLRAQGRLPNLGRLFARGVLAHEHFHAFARTSPLPDGTPPAGPRQQGAWREASPVNEALAAWMQLHMARDNSELSELTRHYIEAGTYPEWPYAGAMLVEKEFRSSGIGAVRDLILLLRTRPAEATAWMVRSAASSGKQSV